MGHTCQYSTVQKKIEKERNRGEKVRKKVNKGKRKEMKMVIAERLGGKRREKRRKLRDDKVKKKCCK